jgi:hypothetical protein
VTPEQRQRARARIKRKIQKNQDFLKALREKENKENEAKRAREEEQRKRIDANRPPPPHPPILKLLPHEMDPLVATAQLMKANDALREGEIVEPDAMEVRPLSIKAELFVRFYLEGHNAGDAAISAGYDTRSAGSQLLRNPMIRARIDHAMGESWVTPEAIVSGTFQIALDTSQDGLVRVKAYEILMKARAMFSDPIKIGNMPKTEKDLDEWLKNEYRRVRGEDPHQALQIGSGEPTALSSGSEIVQVQGPPPLEKCSEKSHLQVRVASDGWFCELCKHHETGSRGQIEAALGRAKYIYDSGVWYHPRARRS